MDRPPSAALRCLSSAVGRTSTVRPRKKLARQAVSCSDQSTFIVSGIRKDITSPQLHTSSDLPPARFDTPSIEPVEFVACENFATDASAPGVVDCLQCILVHSKSSHFRAHQRDPQAAIPQIAHVQARPLFSPPSQGEMCNLTFMQPPFQPSSH